MKSFFNMCVILMLCLFSINAGVIAFEGKIFEGDQDFVDTRAMEQIGIDTNFLADSNVTGTLQTFESSDSSYSATEDTKGEGDAQTEKVKSRFDFFTNNIIINGFVGYWGIIDKIFIAFPELGSVIKVVFFFLQVIGGVYASLVVVALVRGGYNPG